MLESILRRIEAENEAEPLWIVGPTVGQLLNSLIRVLEPETVLEIGSSVGYSALWMAEALQKNGHGHLWTVESHAERFQRAQANIAESGLEAWITQIKHHAPEVFFDPAVSLPETVDLAFLDATKKQHQSFYEALLPRMKEGSILIVDNVQTHREAFEGFIEFMHENPEWQTLELDAGTGLLISKRQSASV